MKVFGSVALHLLSGYRFDSENSAAWEKFQFKNSILEGKYIKDADRK